MGLGSLQVLNVGVDSVRQFYITMPHELLGDLKRGSGQCRLLSHSVRRIKANSRIVNAVALLEFLRERLVCRSFDSECDGSGILIM